MHAESIWTKFRATIGFICLQSRTLKYIRVGVQYRTANGSEIRRQGFAWSWLERKEFLSVWMDHMDRYFVSYLAFPHYRTPTLFRSYIGGGELTWLVSCESYCASSFTFSFFSCIPCSSTLKSTIATSKGIELEAAIRIRSRLQADTTVLGFWTRYQ